MKKRHLPIILITAFVCLCALWLAAVFLPPNVSPEEIPFTPEELKIKLNKNSKSFQFGEYIFEEFTITDTYSEKTRDYTAYTSKIDDGNSTLSLSCIYSNDELIAVHLSSNALEHTPLGFFMKDCFELTARQMLSRTDAKTIAAKLDNRIYDGRGSINYLNMVGYGSTCYADERSFMTEAIVSIDDEYSLEFLNSRYEIHNQNN